MAHYIDVSLFKSFTHKSLLIGIQTWTEFLLETKIISKILGSKLEYFQRAVEKLYYFKGLGSSSKII